MKTGNCELCGESFVFNGYDYRKRYCGRSCSTRANNTGRVKYRCKICDTSIGRRTTDFCSVDCKATFLIQEWLAGREDGGTQYGYVRAFVRKYLKDRSGDRCEQCSFDKKRPLDGRSILQVDHINGDCMNSSLDNLRLLCPNCHAMTETYCGKNTNSGRSWKKKYYSNDQ